MSDAADKLARTRLAIIEHVHRRDRRERRKGGPDWGDAQSEPGQEQWNEEPARSSGTGWYPGLKRAAGNWWRHHPAHLGLELATPVLSAYARRKPALFLGFAAAIGALFMVVRPWRLISLTGLVVALVKSSQLSSVVMSAMSAADFQKDHQPRR